jgi:hypothetical protein
MAENFEIDLDGEQVLFDGTWYSREELTRKIKTMVEAGDFRVARPSSALEALEGAVANLREIKVRLPIETYDALAAVATRAGRPVGALLREALARLVPGNNAPPGTRVVTSQIPVTPGQTGTHAVPAPPAPIPLSPRMQSRTNVPSANEPATAEEAAGAIPLTSKRRDDSSPAPADGEKSWFDRR